MINLLRAEFMKLRKSRAFLICCIVAMIMSLIILFTYKMFQDSMTPEMLEQMKKVDSSFQSGSTMQIDYNNLTGQSMLANSLADNSIQILTGIFTAIFIAVEFSSGAMKNIASKGYSRIKIYTAKYITCVVASEVMALIIMAIQTIGGSLLWGFGPTGTGIIGEIGVFLLLQLLLNAGITGIFIAITTIIRNLGGSIAVNICIIAFIPVVLELGNMIVKNSFNIKQIWIMNTVGELARFDLTSNLILKGLITTVVYLGITFFAGAIQFHNSDIK